MIFFDWNRNESNWIELKIFFSGWFHFIIIIKPIIYLLLEQINYIRNIKNKTKIWIALLILKLFKFIVIKKKGKPTQRDQSLWIYEIFTNNTIQKLKSSPRLNRYHKTILKKITRFFSYLDKFKTFFNVNFSRPLKIKFIFANKF